MPDDERFPLEQWFNLSEPISRAKREEAEEQIWFYALKDGYSKAEVRKTIGQMKAAIREYNARLQSH